MNYVNSNEVLPKELIDEIRKYVDGVYIYIPVNEDRKFVRVNSERQQGLVIRNRRIYDDYLSGKTYIDIANQFFLSEKSVRRIVLEKKREMGKRMEKLTEALKGWDLQGELKQINDTSWCVDDQHVVKEYHEMSMLRRNADVFKVLYNVGIPVPEVVQTVEGRDFYEMDGRGYLVTKKLKGSKIEDVHALTDDWFYRFGKTIGELHRGFNRCQESLSYWNNSLLKEMKGWVSDKLEKYNPNFLDVSDAQFQVNRLSGVYNDLPKQLIHRDVHLGNFLFEGEAFTGYVDFDLSQSNIRIFDLCYFLIGLICKESGRKDYDERWFTIVKEVTLGYDEVMSLSKIEKLSMPIVMMNIELLFCAYFLGQDDERLARDAGELFHFVKRHEDRIWSALSV